MFDDFQAHTQTAESQKRFGGSMALALLLYGGVAITLIGATARARHVAEEQLTQVEFAAATPTPEPPPPPPPPPPPEAPKARPKVERQPLTTPQEVPDEKPPESDEPLTEAEPAGPVDGYLDGVKGGTGTEPAPVAPPKPAPPAPPPPPRVEKLIPPVALPGNRAPTYTPRARRLGIEGLVTVTFEVDTNGAVINPHIVSGPPELGEIVLKAVASWRFRPATRGGIPVRFRKTVPVRFRLEEG
jgi:protein TonB